MRSAGINIVHGYLIINMKLTTAAGLTMAAILAMFGIHSVMAEKLVPEDGMIAAKTLTLDQEVSKSKYETATFGMG